MSCPYQALERPPKSHYLTHFPKHPGCESCSLSKRQRARHGQTSEKDRVHSEKPVNFGDMITADHMVLNEHDSSHDSKRFVVSCYDRATQWIEAIPVASKDAHTTRAALRDFAGTCNPKLFYSDNAQELAGAAKSLGCKHDMGIDIRPRANGVIEG